MKIYRMQPPGAGPCVKQTVTATLVALDGSRFIATNHCLTPQHTCARAGMATGVGYELCRSACQQPNHAEVNAIVFAGNKARGGKLYLEGHTYACDNCKTHAAYHDVKIIIGSPPAGDNMFDDKPTNPKDAIAVDKLPTHLVSPFVKAYQAIAHYLGNVKYGAWNWRAAGIRLSVYKAAHDRHMDAFWEGEWYDPTDGTPHLANALACLDIVIDAWHMGNLVDDRPPSNSAELAKVRAEFEAMMPKIRAKYADKNPKHWTIADTADLAADQEAVRIHEKRLSPGIPPIF